MLKMKTTKKHNEKKPYIPDHPHKILITGGSRSGYFKTFNRLKFSAQAIS